MRKSKENKLTKLSKDHNFTNFFNKKRFIAFSEAPQETLDEIEKEFNKEGFCPIIISTNISENMLDEKYHYYFEKVMERIIKKKFVIEKFSDLETDKKLEYYDQLSDDEVERVIKDVFLFFMIHKIEQYIFDDEPEEELQSRTIH